MRLRLLAAATGMGHMGGGHRVTGVEEHTFQVSVGRLPRKPLLGLPPSAGPRHG